MKKNLLFALFFITLFISGCGTFVSNENVTTAVTKQGYKDVEVKSKHIFFVNWRGCGKDDDAAFKMSAINSIGQKVDLIACAGWPFKGVTVRTK